MVIATGVWGWSEILAGHCMYSILVYRVGLGKTDCRRLAPLVHVSSATTMSSANVARDMTSTPKYFPFFLPTVLWFGFD